MSERADPNSAAMDDDSPSAASMPSKSSGADSIAAILKSSGPVVKCVLLQHIRPTGRDGKPHGVVNKAELEEVVHSVMLASNGERAKPENDAKIEATSMEDESTASPTLHIPQRREVLTELIQEMKVDTTPGKRGVEKILGGSFTFLGQYPDEGVVLMSRADQFADLSEIDSLSVKELKALIQDSPDIITAAGSSALEKSDLVQAVKEAQLPLNPHKLQPPFDDYAVRGDILLLRVADTPEDEDNDNDSAEDVESAVSKAVDDFTSATSLSNEEFFLDYTMEEWVQFASRTDVVAPVDDGDDEGDNGDDEDDEGDEDGHEDESENGERHPNGDDGEDEEYTLEDALSGNDEDDRRLLLNLILGEVIKSFRVENRRGPDSEELLDLRRQVAEKLGLELAPPAPVVLVPKRVASSPSVEASSKRVKFSPEVAHRSCERDDDVDGHGNENDGDRVDDEDDRKMAAIPDNRADEANGDPSANGTS